MSDDWKIPFEIKVLENFISPTVTEFLLNISRSCKFYEAYQIHNGNSVLQKDRKIRKDYHLTNEQCKRVDDAVLPITNELCNCCYRENWKILYYNGNDEIKAFRDKHKDWTPYSHHRRMTIIVALSDTCSYEGGELVFPDLNKRFKLEKRSAIIFDSTLTHEVTPVTQGTRFVLTAFLFDKSGLKIKKKNPHLHYTTLLQQKKTMLLLSTDGGPGNQLVGIKEGLLMSKVLDRLFYFPPIIQHYTENLNRNKVVSKLKYWDFYEVFQYNGTQLCRSALHSDINANVVYFMRNVEVSSPDLRVQHVLNMKFENKQSIHTRKIKSFEDYEEFRNITDNTFVVAHLFNNTLFSACGWNGCDLCNANTVFYDEYKMICKNLDFSCKIKQEGEAFIEKTFKGSKYVSLHLRYQDNDMEAIKSINKKYDESDICNLIHALCDTNSIDPICVFIATNKKGRLANTQLSKFSTFPQEEKYDGLESFIEQYICTQSKIFVYTGGIHAKPNHVHLRSTWSSFVKDYRVHLLEIEEEDNIYLNSLIS